MSAGIGANNSSGNSNSATGTNSNQAVNASGAAVTTKQIAAPQAAALNQSEANMLDTSKILANVDSIGATTTQNALQTSIPGTTSAAKVAGGYDSTTSNMLLGYDAAQASAQGSIAAGSNLAAITGANANVVSAATGAAVATGGQAVNTTGQSTTVAGQTSLQNGGTSNSAVGANVGTVICTQLYRDGHISQEVYDADTLYVRKNFSVITRLGYLSWAVPFVALMRRNKVAYAIGRYFGVAWSLHCASHYISSIQTNRLGSILIAIVAPICTIIGKFVYANSGLKLFRGVQ